LAKSKETSMPHNSQALLPKRIKVTRQQQSPIENKPTLEPKGARKFDKESTKLKPVLSAKSPEVRRAMGLASDQIDSR
jgi:hypothetical protein